jgi:hypothetical protein
LFRAEQVTKPFPLQQRRKVLIAIETFPFVVVIDFALHSYEHELEVRMQYLEIPEDPSSVAIIYNDDWNGDLFCPFCGIKAIEFVDGELEAMVCPHLLCAAAHGSVLYVSDLFLLELQKLDNTLTYERVCNRGSVPWPDADGHIDDVSTDSFCGIVPKSLTIINVDTKTGEEMTVSFVPVPAPRSARLDVKSKKL